MMIILLIENGSGSSEMWLIIAANQVIVVEQIFIVEVVLIIVDGLVKCAL